MRRLISDQERADALLPLLMRRTTFLLVLISRIFFGGLLRTGQAQGLGAYIETYTARLSERDHYNSNGATASERRGDCSPGPRQLLCVRTSRQ